MSLLESYFAISKTPGQPEDETSPGLCVADDPLGSSDEVVDPPPGLSLAECAAAMLTKDALLQSDVLPQSAGGMFRHCLAKGSI